MACLVRNYGSEYTRVLAHRDSQPAGKGPADETFQILVAEGKHGVCLEMAETLSDVILRRAELGSAGRPDPHTLRLCAGVMAVELGWNRGRKERELVDLEALYTGTT